MLAPGPDVDTTASPDILITGVSKCVDLIVMRVPAPDSGTGLISTLRAEAPIRLREF